MSKQPAASASSARIEEQAEVAVRHPTGLQDLAVGVGAELPHWPAPSAVDGWGTTLSGPRVAVLGSAL